MTEPSDAPTHARRGGLSLAPFRAVRYTASSSELGGLLCPPYDVIDADERADLLTAAPRNAVQLILPNLDGDPSDETPYQQADATLTDWVTTGVMAVDPSPAIYVYEMGAADGSVTRGLLGAVELRDYRDDVILPHENTMAGPVADRLALMTATEANLEPIYLVYDGGGAASKAVAEVSGEPLVETRTSDGTTHRLWAITDAAAHREIEADLNDRKALIADGHHRYATYLELQRRRTERQGAGPWDRGLTLLVDSSNYGPQVHAIHRVLTGIPFAAAVDAVRRRGQVEEAADVHTALEKIEGRAGFAAVLTDGVAVAVITTDDPVVVDGLLADDEPPPMADLDVTVLHRGLIPRVWSIPDNEETVGYAHDVDDAITAARVSGGTAILLRPTPVAAVAAVAAAGARMPRKSTLFTPKPASGLVIRRFVDQPSGD